MICHILYTLIDSEQEDPMVENTDFVDRSAQKEAGKIYTLVVIIQV